MTSVQSGVKEAVERVTAGLSKADELGVERTLFGRSGPGLVMSDLRTLLAALSSQAEVMEAMAKGPPWPSRAMVVRAIEQNVDAQLAGPREDRAEATGFAEAADAVIALFIQSNPRVAQLEATVADLRKNDDRPRR